MKLTITRTMLLVAAAFFSAGGILCAVETPNIIVTDDQGHGAYYVTVRFAE